MLTSSAAAKEGFECWVVLEERVPNSYIEDATINNGNVGNITGPIFSIELLGDSVMVTVKIENCFISVKMSNTYDASIGNEVNISILSTKCQIFDNETCLNLN